VRAVGVPFFTRILSGELDLGDRGWTATQATMTHLYGSHRRPLSESGSDTLGLGSTIYLTAIRS
jgi:hypothetical protein